MFSRFTRRMIALLNRTHCAVVPARTRRPHKRQGAFRPRLEALEDRTLLSATLPISLASSGTAMGNDSSSDNYPSNASASVSANGQYAVFSSKASDLVSGVSDVPFSGYHVYLRNLSTGTTSYVDVASNGTTSGSGEGIDPSLTPDGRYVAFLSSSNNLTSNAQNPTGDEVYVRDVVAGQTFLVSLGADGNPANSGSNGGNEKPSIAEDGQGHLLIAYGNAATNLTAGDSNSTNEQVFLATLNLNSSGAIQYDSLSTRLVSGSSTGNGGNGDSWNPIFSKDASTLIFNSKATNLNVPGGYNDNDATVANLYLYSVAGQTLRLLSAEPTATAAATGNAASDLPTDPSGFTTAYQESISANGQYVVFVSGSDNLVPGSLPTSGGNIYRRDLVNGTTSLVSINSTGTSGVYFSGTHQPVITADGRYVAFSAAESDLSSSNAGGRQVYVRDMQQGKTYLVSLGIDGNAANADTWVESIAESSNGQLVIAYRSNATNLTANDTNSNNNQIFVTTFNLDSSGNIQSNTLSTKLASAASSGNGGNNDSDDAILSKDGSTLAFESKAANLAGETADNADGHDHAQVFTFDIASGALTQVSPAAPSGVTADSTWLSSISDNGQYLTYDYQNNTSGLAEILAWNAGAKTNTVLYTNQNVTYGVLDATLISGDGSTVAFNAGNAYSYGANYLASNWQGGSPTLTEIAQSPPGLPDSIGTPSLSDNGKIVVFTLEPDAKTLNQVYVYNVANGTTTLASPNVSGDVNNGNATSPEVSGDGSTVVFNSTAGDMISGITNFITGQDNVFAYNVSGKTVSLVSAKAPGLFTADSDIGTPSISDNGRYVAYYTGANDLLGSLPYAAETVFAQDLQQSAPTVIVNQPAQIYSSVISGDGSTVAFSDNNQLTGIKTSGEQIYAASNWLSSNPTITLVSINSAGNGGANGYTINPSISANGQVIAFNSAANNLTSNDPNANGYTEIFVRNLGTNTTTLASSNSAGSDGGNNNADTPVVSADGSTVIYNSQATDLLSGVSVSAAANVYAYLSNTSAPVITGQPSNQTVTAGQTATLTATASASPAAMIQWQVSSDGGKTFTNVSGATSSTLTLRNTQPSQNGTQYQAVFSNIYGTATTNAATLTVDSAPVVTTNPSSQTVTAGQNVTFMAAASGNPTPTVQWQVSSDGGKTFTNISGATAATLTLTNVSVSLNGYEYRAVFTNSAGSVNSNAATLTFPTAPSITSGNSATFTVGQGGGFTVTTTGSPTPTLTESDALPSGVTFTNNGNGTASLSGAPAAGTQGTYHFTITAQNAGGSVTQSFTLTVNPSLPEYIPPVPVLKLPPLLALFDSLLAGVETPNADGGATVTDSIFGFPLLVSSFDSSGNLVSVDLFGIDVTFWFSLL